MTDDERPKKSWREIDAGRDRSAHRPSAGERSGGGAARGKGRQASYKAALDRLFDSGGIAKAFPHEPKEGAQDESRLKRLAAVAGAAGPGEITRAIDAYLKHHPWPTGELEFASAALEHRHEEIIEQGLASLETLLAAGKPRRTATLAGRLRSLEELSDSAELRSRAARLRSKL